MPDKKLELETFPIEFQRFFRVLKKTYHFVQFHMDAKWNLLCFRIKHVTLILRIGAEGCFAPFGTPDRIFTGNEKKEEYHVPKETAACRRFGPGDGRKPGNGWRIRPWRESLHQHTDFLS